MRNLRNFRKTAVDSGYKSDDPRINEVMQKYGGMGEDELVNKLLESVKMSKANGTYNSEQMNSYIQMLRPHINATQYEKLTNIIKIINSDV